MVAWEREPMYEPNATIRDLFDNTHGMRQIFGLFELAHYCIDKLGDLGQWEPDYSTISGYVEFYAGKQRDYGTENIAKYGTQGIEIRTWDKVARLLNLEQRGTTPANEPVIDTYVDILGYSMIALMLIQDEFHSPLESDM